MDHFVHALKEGLKSLVGGLELRSMDPTTRESSEGLDSRNFSQVRVSLPPCFAYTCVCRSPLLERGPFDRIETRAILPETTHFVVGFIWICLGRRTLATGCVS